MIAVQIWLFECFWIEFWITFELINLKHVIVKVRAENRIVAVELPSEWVALVSVNCTKEILLVFTNVPIT